MRCFKWKRVKLIKCGWLPGTTVAVLTHFLWLYWLKQEGFLIQISASPQIYVCLCLHKLNRSMGTAQITNLEIGEDIMKFDQSLFISGLLNGFLHTANIAVSFIINFWGITHRCWYTNYYIFTSAVCLSRSYCIMTAH